MLSVTIESKTESETLANMVFPVPGGP